MTWWKALTLILLNTTWMLKTAHHQVTLNTLIIFLKLQVETFQTAITLHNYHKYTYGDWQPHVSLERVSSFEPTFYFKAILAIQFLLLKN